MSRPVICWIALAVALLALGLAIPALAIDLVLIGKVV
jgi:uncharacterized membrane protein YidH (DUF202 family)